MDLKPHGELTKTLRVFLKITIAVTVIAVLAGFYHFYSYSTLPSDINANEIILPSDTVTAIVGLVQFIITIVTMITFFRWIYRSNKNLQALSGVSMSFTPGWSVGWYFVPFSNFYKPYQVMKEIWQVSHKSEDTDHSIIGRWWALWLISNFLGRIAFKLVMRADDASSYATSAMMYIISDGLDVVSNIVTLTMVTRIGAAYSRNIVEPTSAAYGGSAIASPPPLT
jgi:Domain of unknown function (DUF4328)